MTQPASKTEKSKTESFHCRDCGGPMREYWNGDILEYYCPFCDDAPEREF